MKRIPKEFHDENTMIAQFMGGTLRADDTIEWEQGKDPYRYLGMVLSWSRVRELRYHLSWDWLMPVVEKIEAIAPRSLQVVIATDKCTITWRTGGDLDYSGLVHCPPRGSKVKMVYDAVVFFLKFYTSKPVQRKLSGAK